MKTRQEILAMSQEELLKAIKEHGEKSKVIDLYQFTPEGEEHSLMSFVYCLRLKEDKEPREITSTTYKRAFNRTTKEVDGFLSGKRRF